MQNVNRVRTKQIRIWLTEEELKIAKDKALYSNVDMSTYIRKIILNGKLEVHQFNVEGIHDISERMNEHNQNVSGLCNNINQITKCIHIQDDTYAEKQILHVLRDFENIRFEYEKLSSILMNRLYGLE